MADISFNIACTELKVAQIAQLNQLFQLLHLVHIYGHGFYEFNRMLMRKNVNNDVNKDSPISNTINWVYSQLSPCPHLAITDTPIIRTGTRPPAKINYRRLTEINSRYYGLSLLRTLTCGPEGVRNKGS